VRLELEAARVLLAPWRWITAPRFDGLEHIPRDRPVMLVGNHTILGALDAPLLLLGLYDHCGMVTRPLGDHLHFGVPLWRDLVASFGVVEGTPENAAALMHAGESLLVFPGGGREVFKRKGQQYRLLWGGRTGFARLAIEHGFPIVPFSAVGAEDVYDIVFDANDLLNGPLGDLVRRIVPRTDAIPPVVRGIGPTMIPRPERFYFRFAPAIETAPYAGRADDEAVRGAVRDRARQSVADGIAALLEDRERDPERALLARLLGRLRGGAGES
jgi:1-acyl-sn-glycerol-3-phosphate acyltransferase